jgi:glycogen phosphorylase
MELANDELRRARIAYFSMEIAISSDIPTYAGGLGVLAGDMLRAAADLRVPMVGVSLIHRQGYLDQDLDKDGNQIEHPAPWSPEARAVELPARVTVTIEGRTVAIRAWRLDVTGAASRATPVLLLDTNLPENAAEDRPLTDLLYGGDSRYRLAQEVVLGVGGVRMLRALGCSELERFHMNEGHAALLSLELLDECAAKAGRARFDHSDLERVRKVCVFTTHTPVASGHDQFPLELARAVLGRPEIYEMHEVFCCEGVLNMTFLALNLSHYVNGVAKRHRDVSQQMFAHHRIDSITNGVHGATWATPAFGALFDRYLPGWREDNLSLRYALNIPRRDLGAAHLEAKRALFDRVRHSTGKRMNVDCFTLGFARRATPYKRAGLLLTDPDRLSRMARESRGIQIIYAGKAHPRDELGKQVIRDVVGRLGRLDGSIVSVYLEDYDMELAKLMVSGVDVWLNTPEPPLEASGTSGMKAAINGVPSLSILDGWWLEGHVEGVTGWAIGRRSNPPAGPDGERDAEDLYEQLERVILPLYYDKPDEFLDVMRLTISLTGSFFNTHRMLQQYLAAAYFL